MDYSDLEFDEEKYYLGSLCVRGHSWNNTGRSLRYLSEKYTTRKGKHRVYGKCVECGKAYRRETYETQGYGVIKSENERKRRLLKAEYRIVEDVYDVDTTKYYIGKLCRYGHDWNNTGFSLRYIAGRACYFCIRDRYHRGRSRHQHICDNCGKKFSSILPTAKYCTRKCAAMGRRNRVEVKCSNCDKTILHPINRVLSSQKNYFCNWECRKEHGHVTRVCRQCGNTFKVLRGVAKRREFVSSSKDVFCSQQCANIRLHLDRRVEAICDACGEGYVTTKTLYNKHKGSFCSPKCFALSISGEANRSWNPRIVGSGRRERRRSAARRRNVRNKFKEVIKVFQGTTREEEISNIIEDQIDLNLQYFDLKRRKRRKGNG
jgi:hypothetical protein